MWVLTVIATTLFISSITFVPDLLEQVSDKTSISYLLLAAFFNPVIDGIALLVSVVLAVLSGKRD